MRRGRCDSVLNISSGRCVLRNGRVGKSLRGRLRSCRSCLNVRTNRCVSGIAGKWLGAKTCANCYAKAEREGEMGFVSSGDNQKRRVLATGERVPMTRCACNRCKVNLCCEACFEEWDHDRNCPPCQSCIV